MELWLPYFWSGGLQQLPATLRGWKNSLSVVVWALTDASSGFVRQIDSGLLAFTLILSHYLCRQRDPSPIPPLQAVVADFRRGGLLNNGDFHFQGQTVSVGDVHRHAGSRRRRDGLSLRRQSRHFVARRPRRSHLCIFRSHWTGTAGGWVQNMQIL